MLVYNYIHSNIAKLILSVWSVYFENKLSEVLSTGRTAPQWVGYLLSINGLLCLYLRPMHITIAIDLHACIY